MKLFFRITNFILSSISIIASFLIEYQIFFFGIQSDLDYEPITFFIGFIFCSLILIAGVISLVTGIVKTRSKNFFWFDLISAALYFIGALLVFIFHNGFSSLVIYGIIAIIFGAFYITKGIFYFYKNSHEIAQKTPSDYNTTEKSINNYAENLDYVPSKQFKLFELDHPKKIRTDDKGVILNLGEQGQLPVKIVNQKISIDNGFKETRFNLNELIRFGTIPSNFSKNILRLEFSPVSNPYDTYHADIYYTNDEENLIRELSGYLKAFKK